MNHVATPSLTPGASVVAIDVGGTDIKATVVDGYGTVGPVLRVGTAQDGASAAERIVDFVVGFTRGTTERVEAVGLVVPGLVDEAQGIGLWSENLGWRDVPFRAQVEARLGLPVAFGHDVRAAGLAELKLGAAQGLDHAAVVTFGTGIASALILGGELYVAGGFAGEIGHIRIPTDFADTSSPDSAFEAIASAAAISRRYQALTGTEVPGALEVFHRADAGDAIAIRVVDQALDVIACVFSMLATTLAPQAIVVGGGMGRRGAALLDPIQARMETMLTFQRRPRLVAAALGADAGVLGAALLAREAADKDKR